MFKEPQFEAIKSRSEDRTEKILAGFTSEQREEIEKKRQTLSALAFFIGKDFEIPVELNEPGDGWHWDFKNNVIRIDPFDLLTKPMEYLCFVISHEGGLSNAHGYSSDRRNDLIGFRPSVCFS